jgi:hypothetical protein
MHQQLVCLLGLEGIEFLLCAEKAACEGLGEVRMLQVLQASQSQSAAQLYLMAMAWQLIAGSRAAHDIGQHGCGP